MNEYIAPGIQRVTVEIPGEHAFEFEGIISPPRRIRDDIHEHLYEVEIRVIGEMEADGPIVSRSLASTRMDAGLYQGHVSKVSMPYRGDVLDWGMLIVEVELPPSDDWLGHCSRRQPRHGPLF